MQSDEPTRKDRILAAGYLDRITLIQISLVLATLSLMLSLLLSIIQTLIIAAILTLSYVYSFKPVRFKARVLSPMLIGLGAFFAFVFGYIALSVSSPSVK